MSTQDLVYSTLERSIDRGLIDEDEATSFDPIVFLSLPRLAVLLGVVGAQIPSDWPVHDDVNTQAETEGEEAVAIVDGGGGTSLTIFLPRICRALSNSTIMQLRSLSDSEVTTLSEMLAGKSKSVDRGDAGKDGVGFEDATKETDARLVRLYKTIASVADRASQGRGSKAWVRVQSRALKAYLDPAAEERVPDVEAIARELLDANR
jgi:hypothetical protein